MGEVEVIDEEMESFVVSWTIRLTWRWEEGGGRWEQGGGRREEGREGVERRDDGKWRRARRERRG